MTSPISVLVVVPLRLKSTRVKEKILATFGEGNEKKPLCAWVCERVVKAYEKFPFVKVLAAVDDIKTKNILQKYLPELTIYVTDPALPSGTDRVFAAVQAYTSENPISQSTIKGIVNVQGDMPFVGSTGIQQMALFYHDSSPQDLIKAPMLTLCQDWPSEKNSPKLQDSSAVKVILNRDSFALYFSRYAIPYGRSFPKQGAPEGLAKFHLGVYGYSKEALARFCASPPAGIEKAEGLEQLRALYLGMPILVFPTECAAKESFRGIDTPADILWAKKFFKQELATRKVKVKKAKRK